MLRVTLLLAGSAVLAAGLLGAWTAPPGDAQAAQVQAAQQSWTGKLADAGCKASSPSGGCEVSGKTTAFGVVTSDGKFFKFDAAGNTKAKAAIGQSGGAANGTVTVTGKLEGDTIHVVDFELS